MERDDPTDWSTLRRGPLHRGLELEVDPSDGRGRVIPGWSVEGAPPPPPPPPATGTTTVGGRGSDRASGGPPPAAPSTLAADRIVGAGNRHADDRRRSGARAEAYPAASAPRPGGPVPAARAPISLPPPAPSLSPASSSTSTSSSADALPSFWAGSVPVPAGGGGGARRDPADGEGFWVNGADAANVKDAPRGPPRPIGADLGSERARLLAGSAADRNGGRRAGGARFRPVPPALDGAAAPPPPAAAPSRLRARPDAPAARSADPWNPLNVSLALAYALSAAAAAVPVTLVPSAAVDILSTAYARDVGRGDVDLDEAADMLAAGASAFASRAAASAAMGTALGKFLNGPLGDIFGARRVACIYSLLLALALLGLSRASTEGGALWACAAVEFFASVQWPCVAVILAAHHRGRDADGPGGGGGGGGGGSGAGEPPSSAAAADGANCSAVWVDVEHHATSLRGRAESESRYEAGIYVVSLASRAGSILAVPLAALSLRSEDRGWRSAARRGALLAASGCAVMFLRVADSPGRLHDPQNPVRPETIASVPRPRRSRPLWNEWLTRAALIVRAVLAANVVPSLRAVLTSGTFWIVAVAHAGDAMVRSSERILGTYLRDTSYGALSDNQAGGLTVSLSLGMLAGLAVWGGAFARLARDPRGRKAMVARMYALAVAMCYALSLLAAPGVRSLIGSPGVVALLQVLAASALGASVAVQFYQIPAIVAATFGTDKGLYAAYTDGVSYGVGAAVWRVVGGAVEEGNPQGSGWSYGWAAVALLVVLCGVLMVEFMEHYFVRGGWGRAGGAASDADAAARKRGGDGGSGGGEGRVGAVADLGGAPSNGSAGETVRRRGQRLLMESGSPLAVLGSIRKKHRDWLDEDEDDDDAESTVVFDPVSSVIDFNDFSPDTARKKEPKTKEEVLKDQVCCLLERPENQVCCDCTNRFPRWASIIVPPRGPNLAPTMGCFVCHACAGSHRKLGTHVLFVRSVDHDRLKEYELHALQRGGNGKVKALYEATLGEDGGTKPTSASDGRAREVFVTAKYGERRWFQSSEMNVLAANGRKALNTAVLADSSSDEESDEEDADNPAGMKSIELIGSPSTHSRKSTKENVGIDIPSPPRSAVPLTSHWGTHPLSSERETRSEPGGSTPGKIAVPESSTFDYSFSPFFLPAYAKGTNNPSGVDLLNQENPSQQPPVTHGERQVMADVVPVTVEEQDLFDGSDKFLL